jgi:hypothetical protein
MNPFALFAIAAFGGAQLVRAYAQTLDFVFVCTDLLRGAGSSTGLLKRTDRP